MTFSSQASGLIVRFLGFSHLLIALGSVASVVAAFVALDLEVDLGVAGFVGCCTGLGYSIQRYIKAQTSPSGVPAERLEYLLKFGGWLILGWGLIWVAVMTQVWSMFDVETLVVLAGLGGAGLGYAILPGRKSLRERAGMKLPVLSLVWGGATVVLPVMMVGVGEWGRVCAARVLYIAGLTIPFDVRDLNVDWEEMRTVPMAWGVVRSLWVACALVVGAGVVWAMMGENFLALHAIFTAVFLSPKVYKPYRGEWYYSILLDGLLLLQLFVLCY